METDNDNNGINFCTRCNSILDSNQLKQKRFINCFYSQLLITAETCNKFSRGSVFVKSNFNFKCASHVSS